MSFHILISNDDGVHAPGLQALVAVLSTLATVTVVAPDRDRSGASNALSLTRPLYMNKTPQGYYAVTGTPTDCVHLAITGLLEEMPDMVVSGINSGANLGDDVLYSGTVAAAMEGRFLGLPAIAISLTSHLATDFTVAAEIAADLIQKLQQKPLPRDTILNVNIPPETKKAAFRYEVTRLGHRHIAEKVRVDRDPRGRAIYWVGPAGGGADAGPGTDFYAIEQGKIALTPLKIDFTDHQRLELLRQWVG